MTPEITLITKRGADPTLSKRIFLDEAGALKSDGSQCRMIEGVATRAFAASAHDLARHIAACGPDQAIALGALKAGLPSPATIVTKQNLGAEPGRDRPLAGLHRLPAGHAGMDADRLRHQGHADGGRGPHRGVGRRLERPDHRRSGPEGRGARVARQHQQRPIPEDTRELIADAGGLHTYVLVKDGSDVNQFLHAVHDQCWLHGLGWHVIGGSGRLLERSLVDCAVGQGERLCFEGQPIIDPPLIQDSSKREPVVAEGQAIDTALVLGKLSEHERHLVREAKAVSADKLSGAANEVRDRHDAELAEKLGGSGVPMPSARRQVKARHRGILLPDVKLDFDDIGAVPVAMVLADPDKFVGETLADPLEGIDYGRCKAKVMRASDGTLVIHTFAHGGGLYRLRRDAQSATAALADATPEGVVDDAMAILAISELEPDELASFAATVAKAAGISVSAVKARVAKQQRERARAQRKADLDAEADGENYSAAAGTGRRALPSCEVHRQNPIGA